jgi:hypothetical protein
MLLELDDNQDKKSRQDRVLSESLPPAAARRELIVE